MSAPARRRGKGWPAWLPFYYGWVIVAVAFVTMAIGVSARTAFSLLMPPMIDEFGWDRGLAAGAFSFGFLVSAILSPFIGRIVDRHGPRLVIETGVLLMAAGLFLAPMIATAWHLYVTLGVLVGGGANLMGYAGQSLYLPNWFQRRRGFAISIAFSGVGAGAILLLPWWQTIIGEEGWRAACQAMGLLVLLVLGPLNLLVRNRPKDLGLLPDGDVTSVAPETSGDGLVRDPAWASIEWTLPRAIRTARFWWLALAFFTALFAWYAVQVHQTAYLIEVGFSASLAAFALGLVSVVAIPGQIGLGTLSDRIGREWVWTFACAGFAVCYASLIVLEALPSLALVYLMVIAQGFFGYALPSIMGAIVNEIFEGPHYGSIFGTLSVALIGGGAAGPWVTGVLHDAIGSYRAAFLLAILCCAISILAIWLAAPRKVRLVPGRQPSARTMRAADR